MDDEKSSGSDSVKVIRDMSAMVEIDGETFSLSQLVDSLRKAGDLVDEVANLRDFQESTTKFMRRDGEPHQLAEAASRMLSGAGYDPEEIKEYISEWSNNSNASTEEDDNEADVDDSEQEEPPMKNDPRYDQLSRETRQMRLRLMQQEMQKGVTEAIDSNSDIGKMLTGLDKTRGREHATGAYQAIQDQIRKATMDRLYERRDKSGGNFSEDWIQEEAARAAADVAKSYSTVIGDFDQIGRTPETVTEMDTLAAKPPVAVPEFKKGMERGDIDTNVRAWNTDSLSRLAMETSAGGESKA